MGVAVSNEAILFLEARERKPILKCPSFLTLHGKAVCGFTKLFIIIIPIDV